ncbi:hypothetical protein [Epilithonimonas caeni]|uniref:hypothetical protein n=1 Tax=Epilithonimonas caeni TaxID=365343 RepID=UPI0003F6DD79|nr:hypothetical protein [Epilithonimonas caeni]
MKKTYLLWLACMAFLLIGCRSEGINSNETTNAHEQAQKFRVVSKFEIPQIMNSLQSKTDNFKIRLRNNSSTYGKTETIFGEINTDFITEINDGNNTYYTFSLKHNEKVDEGNIYNLEVKTSQIVDAESIKVFEYIPTAEWLSDGNNDFSRFSGIVNIYSVGGNLENTVSYIAGTGNCPPPPEPCPDCPTTGNPGGGTGGGGGTDGGGTPGGGWTGGGGSGGGGGGSCGGFTFSHYTTYTNPMGGVVITGEVWVNGCGQEMYIAYKTANKSDCSGSGGGVITLYIPSVYINTTLTAINSTYSLTTAEKSFLSNPNNLAVATNLANYLRVNNNQQGAQFVKWAINFFIQNPNTTWEQINSSKTSFDSDTGDINNNAEGSYDETSIDDYNLDDQQNVWPTISNVISLSDFVGWNRTLHPTWQCFQYADAQIKKVGYTISGFYEKDSQGNNQRYQIYTEQNGVNLNDLYKGVKYIIHALSQGIPVVVGIDNHPGNPGNLDNTTDHFVVIVGMGTDSNGKFFTFYDNASGVDPQSQGANPNNKLYVKYPEKIITGITNCNDYRDHNTTHNYIITQIRKSKKL